MSNGPTDSRPTRPTDAPASTVPLIVWLLAQLVALALGVFRVPLAAKYTRPEESLAPQVTLAAQVAVSALLFPCLMRDWRTATAVIASAWPFVFLASAIAAASTADALTAGGFATVWLLSLATWGAALRGSRFISPAVAVAAVLSIGGATLCYLRLDFAPDAAQAAPPSLPWAWALVSTSCALGGFALLVRCVVRPRPHDKLSTDRARDPVASESATV